MIPRYENNSLDDESDVLQIHCPILRSFNTRYYGWQPKLREFEFFFTKDGYIEEYINDFWKKQFYYKDERKESFSNLKLTTLPDEVINSVKDGNVQNIFNQLRSWFFQLKDLEWNAYEPFYKLVTPENIPSKLLRSIDVLKVIPTIGSVGEKGILTLIFQVTASTLQMNTSTASIYNLLNRQSFYSNRSSNPLHNIPLN